MLDIVRLGFSSPLPGGDRHEEYGLAPGPVPYEVAWDIQRRVHDEVVAGDRPNTLILLEHEPVFTAGRRTEPHERPFDGTPVVDVDRGGKITWHGPRQLVGYPIVRLPAPIDVVGFVRGIEQALIRTCGRLGLETERVDGRSGVWVCRPGETDRKIAAIGLRVSRRVVTHGFALNCANDLSWAQQIIPCGITDAGVTSLSAECAKTIDVPDVIDIAEEEMREMIVRYTAPRDQ
ncbi:lipoyl(octanoyl) transferase LipB [Devriesea agamarum]|uniref:lipoyl(octanoyl) transferase LipB n=1 Tax=Devriesea agamarum TaxID=472569 RepID=UPI00071DF2CA|nr:lipoyl(octanoyl) transferase LipB [Devriesea agamarum]